MATLPAFTKGEYVRAHGLLAAHVAYMMGRKLEEADWATVYCTARDIPHQRWSNLNLDVMHGRLGLELKMLARPPTVPITRDCGTTLMHPSLTRAIRIPSLDRSADEVMAEVFTQYSALVGRRRALVLQSSSGKEPDMRVGYLLWQTSLREFLYFEEPMTAPDPALYRAVWNTRVGSASRLGSKNLWIYERASGKKRYSVTTQAGIKIQPYFDVPALDDSNLYLLTVQGEVVDSDSVRLWATESTARELDSLVGPRFESLSDAIVSTDLTGAAATLSVEREAVREIRVTVAAYEKLVAEFPGVSDELRLRSFVSHLRTARAAEKSKQL